MNITKTQALVAQLIQAKLVANGLRAQLDEQSLASLKEAMLLRRANYEQQQVILTLESTSTIEQIKTLKERYELPDYDFTFSEGEDGWVLEKIE